MGETRLRTIVAQVQWSPPFLSCHQLPDAFVRRPGGEPLTGPRPTLEALWRGPAPKEPEVGPPSGVKTKQFFTFILYFINIESSYEKIDKCKHLIVIDRLDACLFCHCGHFQKPCHKNNPGTMHGTVYNKVQCLLIVLITFRQYIHSYFSHLKAQQFGEHCADGRHNSSVDSDTHTGISHKSP